MIDLLIYLFIYFADCAQKCQTKRVVLRQTVGSQTTRLCLFARQEICNDISIVRFEHFSNFGFNTPVSTISMCVCCIVCVCYFAMVICEPHAQIMQRTHMHKVVTRYLEAKKLLSPQRQLDYRTHGGGGEGKGVKC